MAPVAPRAFPAHFSSFSSVFCFPVVSNTAVVMPSCSICKPSRDVKTERRSPVRIIAGKLDADKLILGRKTNTEEIVYFPFVRVSQW